MQETLTEPPVALITGAARGIGLAIARRFLAEGWRVAMLDIDGETLTESQAALAEALSVAGDNAPRTIGIVADVSDEAAVRAAVEQCEQTFGRLDALVNNAGIAVFKPILETTAEEWRRVLDVNLTGAFLTVQAAAPVLARDGGGAVVNIGSISGLRASTLRVAYGTSKAAVAHLTKQQAAELGEIGVRVNMVAPGPVDTAMAKAVHTPAIRRDYHDAIPLNRYGLEEEIAEAVFFLCSDRASFVTGQYLAVDGGFDGTGIGLPTLRRDEANGAA